MDQQKKRSMLYIFLPMLLAISLFIAKVWGDVFDPPAVVGSIYSVNDMTGYTVTLTGRFYVDSGTDGYSGTSDKLDVVQWQVLWYTGSTSPGFSANSSGFISDAQANQAKFSTAKIFKTTRNDCPASEPETGSVSCLLSQQISYLDLGKVGTYLVRSRHVDQYGMLSSSWSDIAYFIISKLPASSATVQGLTRSVATVGVNVIAADSKNISYAWSLGNTGLTMTGLTGTGMCGPSIAVPSQYKIYDGCIYLSGSVYAYGYVSGIAGSGSSTLKFEPLRIGSGAYYFNVGATKNGATKTGSVTINVTY